MTDPFKKVQAGQSLDISAQAWNAFLDNVRSQKSKKHDELADPPEMFRQADIVKVRNDSGQDCNRFSVLGIGSPIISPNDHLREFKNQVAVSGVVPNRPLHFGKFAILLEPLRNGKIGRAWVSGVCPANINVEDTCHDFADVADGKVTALKSRPVGSAKILWRQGGLGFQWAVVRLSNVADDIRRFKLLGPLARCVSASVKRVVFTETAESKWCATDCAFEVHDSVGVVGATPAPTGSFGWAKWMADSNRWEVLQLGEGCCGSSSDSSSESSGNSSSDSDSSGNSSDSQSSADSSSNSSFSGSSDSSGLSSSGESALSSSFSDGSSSGDSSSDDSSSDISASGDSSSGDSAGSSQSGSSSDPSFSGSNSTSTSQSTASSYSASLISGDVITASNNDKIENSSSNSASSLGSGQTSSSGDVGGLTAMVDVLIPCPSTDAGTTTFPTQRLTFVNGLLQHIESGSPCTIDN